MHGRKPVSTAALAATLAVAALFGGCRDRATTGPSTAQSKDFASALRSVSGDQQLGAVGAALSQQIVVKVVDANGLAVQGAAVTFSVRAGGGSVNPPANTSASTGLVSSTWTMGTTLGANRVVAILTNGFVLDSAVFTATAIAGAPAIFTPVSGNQQTGRVRRALALPLVVKLTDQFGHAKTGVKVTWTPGTPRATFTTPQGDTTAAAGTTSAIWTLDSMATAQTMTASVSGLATVIAFTATGQPDTTRAIVVVSGAGQSGAVSAALATPLRLRVTDQYLNAIAGETVTWNDSLTGGGSVSTLTGPTAADGTAQTTWTLGNHAGPQFLRVKHTASNATLSFTATATVGFSNVLAGNFSACGIVATNQRVYCWGAGDNGQLAKGANISASAPTTAASTTTDTLAGPFVQVRQLAGGRSQFCSLTVARQLACWGRVFFSASINVATTQSLLDGSQQQLFPAEIGHGEDFGCLIELAGIAFCTGQNYSGQLGNGTLVSPTSGNYSFVVPAPGVAGARLYSRISAGRTHACGMPRFNPNNATVSRTPVCWGLNSSGQVGSNTTSLNVQTPTPITPLPAGVTGFDSLSLSAGAQHTCAISTGGAGYCWGNNGFGQLGKGTATGLDSVAQLVVMPAGVTFASMYAGEFHSCALSTAGAAYCWGRNDYGQVGDGTRVHQSAPVAVGGGLAFRSLSLGEVYTCGVVGPALIPGAPSQTTGTVYCWGDNIFGQLGIGTANNVPVLAPTRVLYQP